MRTRSFEASALVLALMALVGCGDGGNRGDDDGAGTDTSTDTTPSVVGALHGTVLAPSGEFPIPGALVYVTKSDGPEIPDSIYCYECEDMTGKNWALSAADGTWSIPDIPVGDWNLVTRKGFFQRQRAVTVVEGENIEVPVELTTLPADNSEDGLDQIPNYAVLATEPDRTYNLLGKLGLATMNGGTLQPGTERFDIYNDGAGLTGYPGPQQLFTDQETLNHYHMIFLPCFASGVGLAFVNNHVAMLQSYVSGGGKIYNSCCVAYWIEKPFPPYIDFNGSWYDDDEAAWDIGRLSGSPLSTNGRAEDQGLADWLAIVAGVNPESVPFVNGYAKVDALVDTPDGHGLEEDDGVVKPYAWVTGSSPDEYQGSPLMTTYNYDCGKVFFSIYETSQSSATITPQEYVLIYITLEVGVCEGDYIPPE